MNCPNCHVEILDILETDGTCPACGARLPVAKVPAPTPLSDKAVASLFLGISAALCCFPGWLVCCFCVPLGLALGTVAVAFGWAALVAIRRGGGVLPGRKQAFAGTILGALAAIACLILMIHMYYYIGD